MYAGTEYGMYISYDDGENWNSFQMNLPIVSITDLTIKNNDLVIATQGRAFWIIDDLSLVQQLNPSVKSKSLHVFDVNPAYRMPAVVSRWGMAASAPANSAVQMATLKPGETLMGLSLSFGGHLTHGAPKTFSSTFFKTKTSYFPFRPRSSIESATVK